MLAQGLHIHKILATLKTLEGILDVVYVLAMVYKLHLLMKATRAYLALVLLGDIIVSLGLVPVQSGLGLGLVGARVALVGLLLEVDGHHVVLHVRLLFEGAGADLADERPLLGMDKGSVLLNVVLGAAAIVALLALVRLVNLWRSGKGLA